MKIQNRIDNYNQNSGYPESLFISGDGRIVGTWVMGQNYTVKSNYYGGYPHGYLKRIKLLFPDKKRILHLFSGKIEIEIFPGDTSDIDPDNNPTYCCNAEKLSRHIHKQYDLILADPPYSIEDALRYKASMIKRNIVLKECAKILKHGGHLVWLDQVLPIYKKKILRTEGYIGMVKSTNHRFRVITIFRKNLTGMDDIYKNLRY